MTAPQMMNCDEFAANLADYLEGDASSAVRLGVETHAASCASCNALLADLQMLPQMAAALPPLTPSRDLWSGIAERIDARVLPLGSTRQVHSSSPRRAWLRPAAAAAALMIVTAGITYTLTKATSPDSAARSVATTPTDTQRQVSVVVPAETSIVELPSARTPSPVGSPSRSNTTLASNSTRTPAVHAASPRTARLVRNDPLSEAEPVYDREIAKLRVIVRQRRAQLDPATVAVLEQSIAVIDSAIAQSRAALAKDPASGFLATQLNHSLDKKVELLRTAAQLPSRT